MFSIQLFLEFFLTVFKFSDPDFKIFLLRLCCGKLFLCLLCGRIQIGLQFIGLIELGIQTFFQFLSFCSPCFQIHGKLLIMSLQSFNLIGCLLSQRAVPFSTFADILQFALKFLRFDFMEFDAFADTQKLLHQIFLFRGCSDCFFLFRGQLGKKRGDFFLKLPVFLDDAFIQSFCVAAAFEGIGKFLPERI